MRKEFLNSEPADASAFPGDPFSQDIPDTNHPVVRELARILRDDLKRIIDQSVGLLGWNGAFEAHCERAGYIRFDGSVSRYRVNRDTIGAYDRAKKTFNAMMRLEPSGTKEDMERAMAKLRESYAIMTNNIVKRFESDRESNN